MMFFSHPYVIVEEETCTADIICSTRYKKNSPVIKSKLITLVTVRQPSILTFLPINLFTKFSGEAIWGVKICS